MSALTIAAFACSHFAAFVLGLAACERDRAPRGFVAGLASVYLLGAVALWWIAGRV